MGDRQVLISPQSQRRLNENVSAILESDVESLTNSISSLTRLNSEGARINGRMSAVRRFFCLFVLFDLLLTSFAWLIIVMLNGDLISCLKKEIVDFTFDSSLFDVVVVAVCRFLLLLICYGCFQLKTRLFVALTTGGSCVFLIVKVLYFKWSAANQTAILVPFLLISFFLVWSEVWLLDFRVVPVEDSANEEQLVHERRRERFLNRTSVPAESGGATEFHSPIGSDDEDDSDSALTKEKYKWIHAAENAVESVYNRIMLEREMWQIHKQEEHASVFTRTIPNLGLVYYLRFAIRMPVCELKREIYDNVAQAQSWNNTLAVSERVEELTGTCDVIYQVVSKNIIGKERDMVLVRKCAVRGYSTIISSVSIDHPLKPEEVRYTRLLCGLSGWIIQQSDRDPSLTIAHLLTCTDLKLWLPQKALITPIANSLFHIASGLQNRALSLSSRCR